MKNTPHTEEYHGVGQGCSKKEGDVVCRKQSVVHVCLDIETLEAVFYCEDHKKLFDTCRFDYYQRHATGADCNMPGSLWDFDENRCVVEEFPVAEPTRRAFFAH